jgi:hypothetical protein
MLKHEIDKVSPGCPQPAAPFNAVVHMYFDSVEAFQSAFAPQRDQGDPQPHRYHADDPDQRSRVS